MGCGEIRVARRHKPDCDEYKKRERVPHTFTLPLARLAQA